MTALRRSRLFVLISLMLGLCSVGTGAQSSKTAPSPSKSARASESPSVDAASPGAEVSIPGPLRSFLRMAGISQKVSPDEVLPLLARNVVVNGYLQERRNGSGRTGKPTEYLLLVKRYLQQARELEALTGADN